MRVSFTALSGKGSSGFAFALLDPDASTKSTGKGGAGLGFAGLSGYALTVSTTTEKGVPIAGITDGHDGFSQLETIALGDLADGWHQYTLQVRDSVIVVSVDGEFVLSREVKLPKTSRLAFTAANGKGSASQIVANVSVGAQSQLSDEELKKQAQQQAVLELLR